MSYQSLCPAFSILSSFLKTLLCSSHWKKFCCQSSFFLFKIVTACHLLLANIARWCQDIPAVLRCLILYWISVKYWHCIGYLWNIDIVLDICETLNLFWHQLCDWLLVNSSMHCIARRCQDMLNHHRCSFSRHQTFVKIALFLLSDAAADAFI